MNVGILLPSSTRHASIGMDFMNGLKAYLKQQELEGQVKFTAENAGIGGTEKEVYAQAEKLLVMEGVDVLLAFIDERVLEMMKPLIYASGKLVVIINPGANYPINWVAQPNMVNLTLLHAFCCWLTGAAAAQQQPATAAVATTFYDCGYLHAAAVAKSYVNHGGAVEFNYVNNDLYNESFAVAPFLDFIAANPQEKNALCIFDELPANLFYKALNNNSAADDLSLFVSPMMLEKKALEDIGTGFNFSIEGYMPWSLQADNDNNKNFITVYREKNKKEPTIFSLLGWEAAMLLEAAISRFPGNCDDGTAIAEALQSITFESPRGALKLDGETHFFLSTPGKCRIERNSTVVITDWKEAPMSEWEKFIAEPTAGAVSGWTNTYLCY